MKQAARVCGVKRGSHATHGENEGRIRCRRDRDRDLQLEFKRHQTCTNNLWLGGLLIRDSTYLEAPSKS